MPAEGGPAVRLPCPGCRRALRVPASEDAPVVCPRCGERIEPAGGPPVVGTAPAVCRICGSPHLYWQKDFDQRIGCAAIGLGAVLVPWTYGISLAVLALADLLLYRLLPRVAVCYVCRARYRGVPPHPGQRPFDLVTAQTYEARALKWSEGTVRPAFPRPGAEPGAGAPAAGS